MARRTAVTGSRLVSVGKAPFLKSHGSADFWLERGILGLEVSSSGAAQDEATAAAGEQKAVGVA